MVSHHLYFSPLPSKSQILLLFLGQVFTPSACCQAGKLVSPSCRETSRFPANCCRKQTSQGHHSRDVCATQSRSHVELPKEFGASPGVDTCSGVISTAIISLVLCNYLICFKVRRTLPWRSHDTHSPTPTTIPQPLGLIT